MTMEVIDIEIAANGEISYVVKGVKGKGCRELTKDIDSIAGKVLETGNTCEYNERPIQDRAVVKE
jgi:hypothetical protein